MADHPASLAGDIAGKIEPGLPSLRGEKLLRPRPQIRDFPLYLSRRTLKFLKSVIARIDVLNFPGSCCG